TSEISRSGTLARKSPRNSTSSVSSSAFPSPDSRPSRPLQTASRPMTCDSRGTPVLVNACGDVDSTRSARAVPALLRVPGRCDEGGLELRRGDATDVDALDAHVPREGVERAAEPGEQRVPVERAPGDARRGLSCGDPRLEVGVPRLQRAVLAV